MTAPVAPTLSRGLNVALSAGNLIERFQAGAHDGQPFVLTYAVSYAPIPKPVDAVRCLAVLDGLGPTMQLPGAGAGPAHRSLVTLKALTYAATAASWRLRRGRCPSTSPGCATGLPILWDYRHCWLRDATFTLQAPVD